MEKILDSECFRKPKFSMNNFYGNLRKSFGIPIVNAQESNAIVHPNNIVKLPGPAEQIVGRPVDIKTGYSGVITDMDVQAYLKKETGNDRLRAFFFKGENGEYTQNMLFVTLGIKQTMLLSFIVGGFLGSHEGRDKHLRKSKATRYTTKFMALRAYNDSIIFHSLIGGLRWMFKMTSFVSIFLLTSQAITVYKNKTNFWEYSLAGFLTGAVLRLNLGPKGMFAGGVLGSVLGTLGGATVWGMMYAAGERQEDRHAREIRELLLFRRRMRFIQESRDRNEEEGKEPPS